MLHSREWYEHQALRLLTNPQTFDESRRGVRATEALVYATLATVAEPGDAIDTSRPSTPESLSEVEPA